MNTLARLCFLPFVRLGWLFITDVTPKHTFDELGLALDDLRRSLFNSDDQALRDQLTAQSMAARSAYSALVISGASDDVVRAQIEQVNTFDRLLGARRETRDAYLGSLVGGDEPVVGFTAVADQPSTTGFLLGAAGSLVGRVFEDREMRDQTIRLKERVHAEREILTQVRSLMTEAGQAVIDARLQALNFAAATISANAEGRDPLRRSAPSQSNTGPRRESIAIA